VATGKLAVPLRRELVPPGGSTKFLGIAGDRMVVAAENRYSVIDLAAMLEKPAEETSLLLARAELTTSLQLQLGELIPLDRQDWTTRWERLVAARQTAEGAAEALARAFDAATTDSTQRTIAARAIRLNLVQQLERLRPNDPRLPLALIAEYARAGNEAEVKRLVPDAIAAARAALDKTPGDETTQLALAQLLLDELPAPSWTRLEPISMTADSGCTLSRLSDGSILAGPVADTKEDRYTLASRSATRRIAALRLEVIPHPSLPVGGIGWASNGNGDLTELTVSVKRGNGTTSPLALHTAASDYVRPLDASTTPADGPWGATDGNQKTRWDCYLQSTRPHWLIVQLKEPCELNDNDELIVDLEFKSGWTNARLGCFRVSVSAAEHAAEVRRFAWQCEKTSLAAPKLSPPSS
jgi:hypothetical protein